MKLGEGVSPFSDTDDGAVGTLAEIGVVTGYDNGTFHPEQTISRAEMWVMVYRVLMRVVEDLLVGIAAQQQTTPTPSNPQEALPQPVHPASIPTGEPWTADWVQIPHTFVTPCYYISYAVSSAGAFAFWLDAQQGEYFDAVDDYLRFTALPGELGFQASFEVIVECPLTDHLHQVRHQEIHSELRALSKNILIPMAEQQFQALGVDFGQIVAFTPPS